MNLINCDFGKIFCIQYLREKSQLELRVVCATHRGKQAAKPAWMQFFIGLCRVFVRVFDATEGASEVVPLSGSFSPSRHAGVSEDANGAVFLREKGTNLGCFTQRIRNLPYRATGGYMKMVKSLILGSAAGLVAMSGAQAADLPVRPAVEYVGICSLLVPVSTHAGTDTCITSAAICARYDGQHRQRLWLSDWRTGWCTEPSSQ